MQSDIENPPKQDAAAPRKIARSLNSDEQDVLVAVMGVTGSGKSTFIKQLTGQEVTIGHGLESDTTKVEVWYLNLEGRKVGLIDTPGFDDTNKSDTDVLKDIAYWLADAYSNSMRLAGIVYMHRITDIRMAGSAMKNLLLFKKLCGADNLSSVALLTTHWDSISNDKGAQREQELIQNAQFWGDMVRQGSTVYRYDNSKSSALRILSDLVGSKTHVVLDIQREMVERGMTLEDTAAGKALQQDLLAERKQHEKVLEILREEMQVALHNKDAELVEILQAQQDDHQARLQEWDRDKNAMEMNIEAIRAERDKLRQQMEVEDNKHYTRLEYLEQKCVLVQEKIDALEMESMLAQEELRKAREAVALEKKVHEDSKKRLEARSTQTNVGPKQQFIQDSTYKHRQQRLGADAVMVQVHEATGSQQADVEIPQLEIPVTAATSQGVQGVHSSTPVNLGNSLDRQDGEGNSLTPDTMARAESDSGYGASIKGGVSARGANSTMSSLADTKNLKEETTPRFDATRILRKKGRDMAKDRDLQEHDLDDEIRSLISNKDEIYSQAPARRSVQEVIAEEHLGVLLAENEKLRPLCIEALTRLEEVRFIDNLRRLLKRFYLDLLQDAKGKLQQATVRLLRHRENRIRIARQVLDSLKLSHEETGALQKQDLQTSDDKLLRLESWIAGSAELGPQFGDTQPQTPVDCSDLDSDMNSDENVTSDGENTSHQWPNILEMEDFVFKGNSFEVLLINLRMFLLPEALRPLGRVIFSVPSDRIWFSEEEDHSLSNRLKSFIEDHTQGRWNWWPLRPRMQPLRKNQIRIHWRCHCDTHLWAELSRFQAKTLQALLRQRGPIRQYDHICRRRKKRYSGLTFSPNLIQTVGSTTNSGSLNESTARSSTAMAPTTMAQTTQFVKSSQLESSQSNRPGTVINDRTGSHVAIQMAPTDQSFILFGVKGTRKTLELVQIDTKIHSDDSSFFRDLRLKYREHRGLWRYWLSVWRLSHCDFVKLEKIRKNRVIFRSHDLPSDPIYEYNPRPPNAENPPISPHEFELAFSSCKPQCMLSRFHDCIEPPTGTFAMERIPKRKSAFELNVGIPEFAWGLAAQHAISLVGVLSYHVLIFVGTLGFWTWWLTRHPADLQNAAVPLTTVAVLISLFWSSAGILKTPRELA